MGYCVAGSARVYSSVTIMGDIRVSIGSRTFIGHQTLITGGGGEIKIESDCDISDRVAIFCGTHEIAVTGPRVAGRGIGKDVTVGAGVWIGLGALILPGVSIGSRALIAAGTVVHRNVPPNCIVGGNPMRIIRALPELRE
jgi:maltose O-acetyltransferase